MYGVQTCPDSPAAHFHAPSPTPAKCAAASTRCSTHPSPPRRPPRLFANVHGRGLKLKPIIDKVDSFDILTAAGDLQTRSRRQNPDLFRLAIGGYGRFGIFTAVRPRLKVRRIVKLAETATIPEAFAERIKDACLYGDFQLATDVKRDSFLRRGVFSCCQPASTPPIG